MCGAWNWKLLRTCGSVKVLERMHVMDGTFKVIEKIKGKFRTKCNRLHLHELYLHTHIHTGIHTDFIFNNLNKMLFEAKGWNLKNSDKIALGGAAKKKKKNTNNSNKNNSSNGKKGNSTGSSITEEDVERVINPTTFDETSNKNEKLKKNEKRNEENKLEQEQNSGNIELAKSKRRENDKLDKIGKNGEASNAKSDKKRQSRDDDNDSSTKVKRSKAIQKSVNTSTTLSTTPANDSVAAPMPIPVTSQTKLTPLQQKMMSKLSGSRFRWINEQLYTITSEEALKLIREQPSLFDEYHQGFRSQVSSWPENPVDVFVNQFKQRLTTRNINAPGGLPGNQDKRIVVADMGCGEAQFSADIGQFVKQLQKKGKKYRNLNVDVHSFDLKKYNERITVADIKNVPLASGSASIVIFCLALMGTNFLDFIKEAYRILQPRGELWIAEIKSRFTDGGPERAENVGSEFVEALKLNGFFHKLTDNSNKMFTRFEFFKPPQDIIDERRAKLERKRKFIEEESEKEKLESKREKRPEGEWLLKPCIYKRR